MEENIELARLFIEHGADVNFVLDGWTPLHGAQRGGHAEVVRLLESAGALAKVNTRKMVSARKVLMSALLR